MVLRVARVSHLAVFRRTRSNLPIALGACKVKGDDGIFLENLFDDLGSIAPKEIVSEVLERLPKVKNPGAWATPVEAGKKSHIVTMPTMGIYSGQV
jgi:hypothetical protein